MRITSFKHNCMNLFIVCALVLVSVTPMIGSRVPMIIIMALDFLWVIDILIKKNRSLPGKAIIYLPLLIIGIVFAYKIIGISSAEWGNYAVQLFFYTSIWMMHYISDEYSISQKRSLSFFCYYLILANIISNIYMYYTIGRYTSWSYVSASKMEDFVRNYNLGSTSFVSTVTIFSGVAFSLFVCTKDKKKKILFAIGSILSLFYLIVCSGRATTLIQIVVMFVLFFLYRNERTSNVVPLVIVFLAIVFYLFRIQILNVISDLLPNERMAVRIRAIGQFVSGVDVEGDYLSRIEIIALDFSTWLRSFGSFFFGIGDHRYLAGHLSDIYTIGISGHSDYFDFLAKYGIVGFTLLNILFISLLKYFRTITSVDKRFRRYISIVFLVFLMRSVIGSIFSTDIAAAMFIFASNSMFMMDERNFDSEQA